VISVVLGSTTHIANASGALLESYRYDLYGTAKYYDSNGQLKATQVAGYGVNDLYAGERWIAELAVYDLRNRFMSPELGRFLQADPIGFKGDASNLYRYCGNDPVDKSDPTGLISVDNTWSRLMYWQGNAQDSYNQIAEAYRNWQPAGITMARVEKNEGSNQGLKYKYDRYPENGPGGRPEVERAMKRLGRTAQGRAYMSVSRTVFIRPVDRDHATGSYIGAVTGNYYLYLDPTNDRFYDAITFRNMSRHKGETPPDSVEGRAAVIAHEFGHISLGYGRDIDSEIRNVRYNENPARDQLEIERRPSYDGNYVPNP
jgi:RHS repeat-associated protein